MDCSDQSDGVESLYYKSSRFISFILFVPLHPPAWSPFIKLKESVCVNLLFVPSDPFTIPFELFFERSIAVQEVRNPTVDFKDYVSFWLKESRSDILP